MRKLIQSLANKCGYNISKVSKTNTAAHLLSMKQLLDDTENPIIFDVGAHHGHVSAMFRQIFPRSTVYAFEPFEESFRKLQENTASDEKIIPFNFGFSDQNGTQAFHSNSSSVTNSLLSTDHSGPQTWGSGLLETKDVVQAEFKTIDSFVDDMQIPRIDVLKLDVQGAEHLVLKGADSVCDRGLIQLIYSEIITQPTYAGQKRFDDALSSYYNKGYDLFNLYNLSHTSNGQLRQVDAIFTKTDQSSDS